MIPKPVLSIVLLVIGGICTTAATWLDIQDTIETAKELAEETSKEDEEEEEEE